MKTRVYSPYTVMTIVLIMYAVKVVTKLTIGAHVNSPMITGDGYHNVADIFEALLVIAAVAVSRMPPSEKYPFGRKNIESIFSVVVGAGLVLMALRIGWESAKISYLIVGAQFGFVASYTPPLKIGTEYLGWVVGVTLGSTLLSVVVGNFQIRAGKAMGHEALTADGKETLSDGRIEFVTFIGIIGEYLFHAPWIEYPFAILVAIVMSRTGIEIFLHGFRALLQRTIGLEHDQAMKEIVRSMPGVADVAELKSFRVGSRAIVIVKVITHADSRARRLIKLGLAKHVTAYLNSHEFSEAEFYVRFDRSDPGRTRRAIAVRSDAEQKMIMANSLEDATHLIICDMEFDQISRATVHEVSALTSSIVEFLRMKKSASLLLFSPNPADHLQFQHSGIELVVARSARLSTLGL